MLKNKKSKTFESGVDRLFRNIKKSLTSTALITSSATFLLGLASTGIMGIGGYMIIDNTLTIGEFLSFTLYLGFMIAPIVQMSNIGSQLTEAFAGPGPNRGTNADGYRTRSWRANRNHCQYER